MAGHKDFPSVLLKVNAESTRRQLLNPDIRSAALPVYQPYRKYKINFIVIYLLESL